jgi:hypothetical protein
MSEAGRARKQHLAASRHTEFVISLDAGQHVITRAIPHAY